MARFAFKAVSGAGEKVRGIREALGTDGLVAALERDGLYPWSVKPLRERSRERRVVVRRVPRVQLVHVTGQLAIVVRSHVPLVSGLSQIAQETVHPGLKAVLADVARRVEEGDSLAAAMGAHPAVFDSAYRSVVSAGEESGSLDKVLERMAGQMEWALDTRRDVRSALIQPAILGLAVAGLVGLVVGVFVPKISELFTRQGMRLPALTQMLVNVSDGLRSHGLMILGGIVALVVALRFAVRTTRGRLVFDGFKVKLPVLGRVIELFAASRFVSLFTLLHDSGVIVGRNLEIVAGATGSAVMDRGVARLRESVMDGKTLSEGAHAAGVFPPLVVRMLTIGEQTGHLTEAMGHVGAWYDKELPRALKRITTVLQPLLLLLSAGIVAFVVFAAFLPIAKLVTGGKG